MLLIYTPKITSRLKFVFKQICTRILGIPIDFTTTIEVFIAHSGLKMSYGPQPLGSEFLLKVMDYFLSKVCQILKLMFKIGGL